MMMTVDPAISGPLFDYSAVWLTRHTLQQNLLGG